MGRPSAAPPLRLIAFPDEATRTNHFELAIPKAASLILTHTLDGEIRGLDEFPDHPPVAPLFWGFRVMVGTGVLMLAVAWLGAGSCAAAARCAPWLQRVLIAMTFSGWVATIAGWYVTEIGRQPWLVTGVLRTADAASTVPAPMIGLSLAAYLSLYVVLLLSYVTVLFHMARKAGSGPGARRRAAGAGGLIMDAALPLIFLGLMGLADARVRRARRLRPRRRPAAAARRRRRRRTA